MWACGFGAIDSGAVVPSVHRCAESRRRRLIGRSGYSIAEAILIFGREMVILPDSYVFYTLNSLL